MTNALLPKIVAAGLLLGGLFFAAIYAADITLRPPQPLAWGTVIWWGETGFTVLGVERVKSIAYGGERRTARGTYYIVDAKVLAPFGERYAWDDANVQVRTFSGRGGRMRGLQFPVDAAAQRLLDRSDGRPGPHHTVLGASQRERLVFDLPDDVEQPGLVFEETLDPWNALDLLFGRVWEPHRFNLRYD